nr:hypothetical protein [Streptococcus sp. 11-4097]
CFSNFSNHLSSLSFFLLSHVAIFIVNKAGQNIARRKTKNKDDIRIISPCSLSFLIASLMAEYISNDA